MLQLEQMEDDPLDLAAEGRLLRDAQPFDLLGQVFPIEALVGAGTCSLPQHVHLLLRPGQEVFVIEGL